MNDAYKPRNACQAFAFRSGKTAVFVPKAEFDTLCDTKAFVDGPYMDTFGDGYGEPYNPYRQAWGVREDKTVVFTELHESLQSGPDTGRLSL